MNQFKGTQGPWKVIINGLKEYAVAVKGVDFKQAHAHISVILGSFEPKHEHKHEHKIAGCAYLASMWFVPETVK